MKGLRLRVDYIETSPLINRKTKQKWRHIINNGGFAGAKSISFCGAVMASSTVGTAQQGGCGLQRIGLW